MWVLKSEEENEKDLRHDAIVTATLAAVFVFVVIAFGAKIGYDELRQKINPISWGDLFHQLKWFILVAVVIFFFVYRGEKKEQWLSNSRTIVCLRCGEMKAVSSPPFCQCGGRCVDLNHAKWVETGNTYEKPNS